jgi:hypothetical protein
MKPGFYIGQTHVCTECRDGAGIRSEWVASVEQEERVSVQDTVMAPKCKIIRASQGVVGKEIRE